MKIEKLTLFQAVIIMGGLFLTAPVFQFGVLAQESLRNGGKQSEKVYSSSCPEVFFEVLGDLPGDCILSNPTDISNDGSRICLMSSSDEPDVPNDGGACDAPVIWTHSNEAAGWTRPCEHENFFTPPINGPGGLVGFGYLPGENPAHSESMAWGISPDGKVVVGHSNYREDNGTKAVVITGAGMQELAILDQNCIAIDISQTSNISSFGSDPELEGRIIVGYTYFNRQYSHRDPGAKAVYWDDWGSIILLPMPTGPLPNDSAVVSSEAIGISDDGRVICGNLYYNKRSDPAHFMSYPCVWLFDPGSRGTSQYQFAFILGDLPGGDDNALLTKISGNGLVIVGAGNVIPGGPNCWNYLTSACEWRLSSKDIATSTCSAPIQLSYLSGYPAAKAMGVNYNGTVIVGTAYNVTGPCTHEDFFDRAVTWKGFDPGQQPTDLSSVLNGLIPDGFEIQMAMCVSADGMTVTGNGVDADYNPLAWAARLPGNRVPLANWAVIVLFAMMILTYILILRLPKPKLL